MDAKAMNLKSKNENNVKNPTKAYMEFRKLHVRPWIRLWAKTIDLSIFSWILILIAALFSLNTFADQNMAHHSLRSFLIVFFWFLIIEPLLLATWGTTLGRLLLNISLLDSKKNKLTFNNALSRSLRIWYAGFGFGLPIVSLFTFYFSYRRLKNTGSTYWDKNKFIVTHGKIGVIRITIVVLLILTPIIASTAWQLHQHPLSSLTITKTTIS